MSRQRRGSALAIWMAGGLLAAAAPSFAETAEEANRAEQRLERVQASREARSETSSEARDASLEAPPAPTADALPSSAILDTLKRRARAVIERRRARRWAISTYTTLSTTIDTNPNLDSSRKGDGVFEESTDLTVRWRWFKNVSEDVGYRITNDHYVELRDNNYTDNTLYTTWRYTPWRWLRLTAGYEFTALNYYENRSSSLDSHRVYVTGRHSLPWQGFFYESGWSYFYRRYSVRKANDGTQSPTDDARHDTRHTVHWTVGGTPFWKTLLQVRQEAYFHFSNDAFQDFYDTQVYKVRLTASRSFWKQWRGSGTFSVERKNYTERLIATTVVKGQADNTFSYSGSLTYNLSPDVSLVYTYTRRKVDSNTPLNEYTDTTNQFSLNASF